MGKNGGGGGRGGQSCDVGWKRNGSQWGLRQGERGRRRGDVSER